MALGELRRSEMLNMKPEELDNLKMAMLYGIEALMFLIGLMVAVKVIFF